MPITTSIQVSMTSPGTHPYSREMLLNTSRASRSPWSPLVMMTTPVCQHEFDNEARHVGRRGPERPSARLRVDVPPTPHLMTVSKVPGRCTSPPSLGKRVQAAVLHAERLEDALIHEIGKGLPGDVHHELLSNQISAIGVAVPFARG